MDVMVKEKLSEKVVEIIMVSDSADSSVGF